MDDESTVVDETTEQVADDQVEETEQSDEDADLDTGEADNADDNSGYDREKYVPREELDNLKKALHEERQKNRSGRQAQPEERQTPPAPRQDPNDLSDVLNEDGTIDPIKYAQKIKQETLRESRAQAAEEKDWDRAVREYPELDQDPDLAAAVRGLRDRKMVLEGEFLSHSEAAQRILGRFKDSAAKAKEDGRKEAQVSETIQKRAIVDRPSNRSTDSRADKLADAKARMYKGTTRERDAARMEYVSLLEE